MNRRLATWLAALLFTVLVILLAVLGVRTALGDHKAEFQLGAVLMLVIAPVSGLVVIVAGAALLLRGLWRVLRHRGEDDAEDDGLTALLDATQEIRLGDAITEEIDMREFEAEFQLRRTIRPPWAIRDFYVMPEDFR